MLKPRTNSGPRETPKIPVPPGLNGQVGVRTVDRPVLRVRPVDRTMLRVIPEPVTTVANLDTSPVTAVPQRKTTTTADNASPIAPFARKNTRTDSIPSPTIATLTVLIAARAIHMANTSGQRSITQTPSQCWLA